MKRRWNSKQNSNTSSISDLKSPMLNTYYNLLSHLNIVLTWSVSRLKNTLAQLPIPWEDKTTAGVWRERTLKSGSRERKIKRKKTWSNWKSSNWRKYKINLSSWELSPVIQHYHSRYIFQFTTNPCINFVARLGYFSLGWRPRWRFRSRPTWRSNEQGFRRRLLRRGWRRSETGIPLRRRARQW